MSTGFILKFSISFHSCEIGALSYIFPDLLRLYEFLHFPVLFSLGQFSMIKYYLSWIIQLWILLVLQVVCLRYVFLISSIVLWSKVSRLSVLLLFVYSLLVHILCLSYVWKERMMASILLEFLLRLSIFQIVRSMPTSFGDAYPISSGWIRPGPVDFFNFIPLIASSISCFYIYTRS